MTMYTVLNVLHSYVNKDLNTIRTLENSALFFVPVVNLDGFTEIGRAYKGTGKLEKIRKNRHKYAG
jgi:murein tripeptide amidase MpaA